jgi:hypothetical protein
MKTFTPLCFILCLLALAPHRLSAAAISKEAKVAASLVTENTQQLGLSSMTIEDFLELRPRDVREMTGERLGLKGAIALRAAQRQVKKAIRQPVIETDKDQLVALILCIMVGWMGIHRMYLGYYGIGIIQLLTLGCCGLWTLLDMIRIITGNLQPKEGLYGETL